MRYKLILIFFIFLQSCSNNYLSSEYKQLYSSSGFAYIYNLTDEYHKNLKIKKDLNAMFVAHDKLRSGSLIRVTNPINNSNIILKNLKKVKKLDFYKIIISNEVAKKLGINKDYPYVEIEQIKKNKSFVAKKTITEIEEKKIFSSAPVSKIEIDNISKNKNNVRKSKYNFSILIAEFYSIETALALQKRIKSELINLNVNKLKIIQKKRNKVQLLCGPYNSLDLLRRDYIELKKMNFEELDVKINK